MSSNTIIRNSVEHDRLEILKLLEDLGYKSSDSPDFKEVWKQILNDDNMGVIVAVTDDVISGYLAFSLKPQLRLSGLSLEVDELSVGSQFRGLGIGTRLLDHIKKVASDRGVKRILISTNKSRESYRREFYSKNGFTEKDSAWFELKLAL